MTTDMAIANELHERFCLNLRAIRKASGLTQAKLAERLRVTQPVVAALEAGRRVPSLTVLQDVANALRVDPRELLKPASEFDTKLVG